MATRPAPRATAGSNGRSERGLALPAIWRETSPPKKEPRRGRPLLIDIQYLFMWLQ